MGTGFHAVQSQLRSASAEISAAADQLRRLQQDMDSVHLPAGAFASVPQSQTAAAADVLCGQYVSRELGDTSAHSGTVATGVQTSADGYGNADDSSAHGYSTLTRP